jgi:hypothetical protein
MSERAIQIRDMARYLANLVSRSVPHEYQYWLSFYLRSMYDRRIGHVTIVGPIEGKLPQ